MIKEWLFEKWSWKSYFVGMFSFTFPMALVWNLPINQTRMMIEAGMNPFWILTILLSIAPLSFLALNDIMKRYKQLSSKAENTSSKQ